MIISNQNIADPEATLQLFIEAVCQKKEIDLRSFISGNNLTFHPDTLERLQSKWHRYAIYDFWADSIQADKNQIQIFYQLSVPAKSEILTVYELVTMKFKDGKWLIKSIHRLQSNPNETLALQWKPLLAALGQEVIISSKHLHDDIFLYTSSTPVSTKLPEDTEPDQASDLDSVEDTVVQFAYEATNSPYQLVKSKYFAADTFASEAENYNLQLFVKSIANCQILDVKQLETSEVAVIAEFTCQGISCFMLYGGKITLKVICCHDNKVWKIKGIACPAQVSKVEYDPISFIYP